MQTNLPDTNAIRAARAERILKRHCLGDDLATSLIDLLALKQANAEAKSSDCGRRVVLGIPSVGLRVVLDCWFFMRTIFVVGR
jgi:hypothetical protein